MLAFIILALLIDVEFGLHHELTTCSYSLSLQPRQRDNQVQLSHVEAALLLQREWSSDKVSITSCGRAHFYNALYTTEGSRSNAKGEYILVQSEYVGRQEECSTLGSATPSCVVPRMPYDGWTWP